MIRRAAVAVVALLAVSGCGTQSHSPETSSAGGTMTTSPLNSDDAGRALVTRIEQALAAHAPGLTFGASDVGHIGCGKTGTAAIFLAIGRGPVPDSAWPAALADVERIVGEYGLTKRTVLVDKPGRHDVAFGGPAGGRVALGTEVNATLTVETTC